MIQEGIVVLSLKGIGPENDFFILPTYTYFGDFQILYDLKSQLVYKSGESKHLITMCLKKGKLKELMDDYADAKAFYMKRAWHRRIEFRRRMKKHQLKLESIQNAKKKQPSQSAKKAKDKKPKDDSEDHSSQSHSFSNSDESEEDSLEIEATESSVDDSDSDSANKMSKKKMKQKIKFMSKIYCDVDPLAELVEDIDPEELERISEDEQTESREDILKERNKKKSQQNAENIQLQMIQMGHAFARMNQSLGKNLICVN
jgi:hypothetical protein